MIRKITLENYMAHAHTVIEPAAGLTVLIGPNNCGKSAIIHALEMICYNSDAAGFAIRHGAKKATVTIETVDESGEVHTLVWWRKKATAGYIIDGREISGLGRGQKIPDDLHQFLKMPEIPALTGNPFRIHFGLQKSPIFLLDDPESRAAQFFASSSDADRLMEMQRRHTQKALNSRRDKEKLDQEIESLDTQLAVLAPVPELAKQLSELETTYAQINLLATQLAALARSIEALERAAALEQTLLARVGAFKNLQNLPAINDLSPLQNSVRAIADLQQRVVINQSRQQVLVELNPMPDVVNTSVLIRLIGGLGIAQSRVNRDEDRIRVLGPLEETPAQHETAKMRDRIAAIQIAQRRHDRLASRRAQLELLQSIPEIEKTDWLLQAINRMQSLTSQVLRQQERLGALDALPGLPEELDLKPMRHLLVQLDKAKNATDLARRHVESAEQKLKDLRVQIEAWVARNPQCESCGQTINAELILAGGHAHG